MLILPFAMTTKKQMDFAFGNKDFGSLIYMTSLIILGRLNVPVEYDIYILI